MNHAQAHLIFNAIKEVPAIKMKNFLTNAVEKEWAIDLGDMPEDMLIRLSAVHQIPANARGDYYVDSEMNYAFNMVLDEIKKMDRKAVLNGNCIDDPSSWSYSALTFDPIHVGPEVRAFFKGALSTDVTRQTDGSLTIYATEKEVVHYIPLIKRIMRAARVEVERTGESEYSLDFMVSIPGYDYFYNLVDNPYGRMAVKNGEEHINGLWWLDGFELEPGYDLIECGEGIYLVGKYNDEEGE